MYTHELADGLKKLASVLKSGPNIELGELLNLGNSAMVQPSRNSIKSKRSGDLPIALSALLSLATIDKREWVSLIEDMNLNIEIRAL